jgi:3,4-dihydroxyphenylacetate 2,3-dioxygenase
VSDELPDLIPGVPYDRPGDPEFGAALVDAIKWHGLLAGRNETPHYKWDYGTFVPLQYLDPAERIPVVTMGTCILADLDECYRVGQAVRDAAEGSGKRVVFVASSALSHRLVRNPAAWPLAEHRALDRQFVAMLEGVRLGEARRFLDGYAKETSVEMGGRNIASFLGAGWSGPPVWGRVRRVRAVLGCRAYEFRGCGGINKTVFPAAGRDPLACAFEPWTRAFAGKMVS